MAFSSRAELRTAVLAWLGFVNGEIADSTVNRWIALCEADLNRRVRSLSRQETADLVISSGSDIVDRPAGFRQLVDLYLNTSPRQRVLLRDIAAVRAAQAAMAAGPPKFVAVKGDSTFDHALIFAPVPDAVYTGKITYWRQISLSNDDASNSVLEQHSDAYLYGTLIHAEGYIGNDPRIPTFEDLYLEAVASIQLAEKANEKTDQGVPA